MLRIPPASIGPFLLPWLIPGAQSYPQAVLYSSLMDYYHTH